MPSTEVVSDDNKGFTIPVGVAKRDTGKFSYEGKTHSFEPI